MNPVTILLPVLELDEFFFQTLESILAVDYTNLELLIVHDCQTEHEDDFRGLEGRVEGRGMKLTICHSLVPGLASTLNLGLNIASHEYVCRIDADDLITPSRIKKQVEYLNENPNVAVIGGQLRFMNQDGEISERYSDYPTTPEDTKLKLLTGCFIAHPAVMFRKSAVLAVGGYRTFFKTAEDYDLWLRVIEFRDISNLPDVVTIYRQHEGQMSSKLKQVDLYTRIAKKSYSLRQQHIVSDLPGGEVNLSNWLSEGNRLRSKTQILSSLNSKRNALGDSLIFRAKLTRSRGMLPASVLFIISACIVIPIRAQLEIGKFSLNALRLLLKK